MDAARFSRTETTRRLRAIAAEARRRDWSLPKNAKAEIGLRTIPAHSLDVPSREQVWIDGDDLSTFVALDDSDETTRQHGAIVHVYLSGRDELLSVVVGWTGTPDAEPMLLQNDCGWDWTQDVPVLSGGSDDDVSGWRCAWEEDVPAMVPGHHEGTFHCDAEATVVLVIEDHVYSDECFREAYCRAHADRVLAESDDSVCFSAREVVLSGGSDDLRVNPPAGWSEQPHDGTLACPHRDVSVCTACAEATPEAVDVHGAHFWITDPADRALFLRGVSGGSDDDVRHAGTVDPALEVTAEIPGTFVVDIVDGEVRHVTFTPHAGAAGHFGPSARLLEGEYDPPEDALADGLLEDVEGPFWGAIQRALQPHSVFWSMDDQDDDTVRLLHTVPIEWAE